MTDGSRPMTFREGADVLFEQTWAKLEPAVHAQLMSRETAIWNALVLKLTRMFGARDAVRLVGRFTELVELKRLAMDVRVLDVADEMMRIARKEPRGR